MQHAILNQLHRDHINMARLAGLIDAELAHLARGVPADLELLEDIMVYVTAYPDACHHPTEDVVFAQLSQRWPQIRDDIEAILAEHRELIDAGAAFLGLIRSVEEEALVERSQLLETGAAYLGRLRAHMDAEESGLFRLAAEHLGPADWKAIEAGVEAIDDPLFGSAVATDHRRLWQRINAHSNPT